MIHRTWSMGPEINHDEIVPSARHYFGDLQPIIGTWIFEWQDDPEETPEENSLFPHAKTIDF